MSDSFLDEIASIHQRLRQQWLVTQSKWIDKRARKFERDHWRLVEANSQKLLKAAHNLSKTLKDAQGVCRDR